MRQFLLFTSILLSIFGRAQELRIIKDNVNCTYGLKNENGNWVVEPVYILIQEYNSGYFLVKDALGDGVFSPSGQPIIGCKYDQLTPIQPKWGINGNYRKEQFQHPTGTGFFFLGNIGNEKVVINSRGKEIAHFSDRETLEFDGNAHFFIRGNQPTTSTYLDTTGRILIHETKGEIEAFGENRYSLIGEKKERYSKVLAGNVRLINRNGEYPLNIQFERAILASDDKICFETNSKYGEISTNGTILIEPKYRRDAHLSSAPNQKENWVIYDETEKVGLMNPDGTVILEPIYTEIKASQVNKVLNRYWIVTKDGLKGVCDKNGKLLLSATYDEIDFVYYNSRQDEEDVRISFVLEKEGKFAYINPNKSTIPHEWYDRIQPINDSYYTLRAAFNSKLITEQNDKFGLLNMDGTIQSNCVFDGHAERIHTKNSHFFWKNLNVYEFNLRGSTEIPKKWEVHFTSERFILFTDSHSYIAGTLADSSDKLISLDPRNQKFRFFGNMMIVNRDGNHDWEFYHTKTKEKIELKNVVDITRLTNDRFLIKSRAHRVGIIDSDGKLMIKPDYHEFKRNNKSTHVWAWVDQDRSRKNKWVLLDENGKQVFSDTVLETFQVNSGDLLMTIDDKTGLFDTETLKWKIEPTYPCLFKSVGDFYVASFAQDKKGILRSDGTVLLPMNYKTIRILTANLYEKDNITLKRNPEIRWLVTKNRSEILVDQHGNQLSSTLPIQNLKESLLFEDTVILNLFGRMEPREIPAENIISPRQTNEVSMFSPFLLNPWHTATTSNVQNFPTLDYSKAIQFINDSTEMQIRQKKHAVWSNYHLKRIIFDSINAHWNNGQVFCSDQYGRSQITAKQEQEITQEFKEDCSCAQRKHTTNTGNYFGGKFYQLDPVGKHFASITYGYHPVMDDRFMTMSQPPPPPPPAEHMNFIYLNGEAISIELNDIFRSDSLLLQEFILALQQRDDLQLDCSSLENMIEMINGRFSLSKEGVHLHYSSYNRWNHNSISFLIPLERLKLHKESYWLVPILEN